MTYENPPIQEAVFDIQVDRLSIESVDQLRSFRTKLHNDFHSDEGKPLFNVTVQIGAEGKQSQTEPKTTGYLFKTKGKQVQVRENSLTLNVLRPYSNWENHFSEFEGYWELFKELFQPVTVQRIATRFINRIEIPIPFKNFEDYISNMPPIPKILPQNFSSFFMQIQVPYHGDNQQIIVTEAIETPANGKLPFILDIDVFQSKNLSFETISSDFLRLRSIKNDIFENCITDETRKLFV